MDKAQVVERMALIAHHQTPEITQPSEEALDLPAPSIAPQGTPILGLGSGTPTAMGRDHLDAQRCQRDIQRDIQRIGVIGAVADETNRQVVYETGVKGGGDEGNLVRRS